MPKIQPDGFAGTAEAITVATIEPFPINDLQTEPFTLKALGDQLPIGVFHEGQRLQTFTLKEYGGEAELELSSLSKRFQGKVAEVLPIFLGRIVSEIGGISVADLARSADLTPSKFMEQLPLSDGLTMLLRLRLQTFGNELKISARCPHCGFNNKDGEGEFSDLETTEVNVAKSLPSLHAEILLERGATLFEDTVDRVSIRPVKIGDLKRFNKQKGDKSQFQIHHELLLHTVTAMPQSAAYSNSLNETRDGISRGAVEELYKKLNARDRDKLIKSVAKLNELGPSLQIEMICRSCGAEDWNGNVPWQDLAGFLSFAD